MIVDQWIRSVRLHVSQLLVLSLLALKVKISQIEWHGDWWIRVTHDTPRKSTFDIRAIQNQYIIKEDAD
eukprot:4109016-Amphidinium_carterae.1